MSSKESLVRKTFGKVIELDSSQHKEGSTSTVLLSKTVAGATVADGSAVLTVAQVKAGFLVQTPTANSVLTLPTATALLAELLTAHTSVAIGDTLDLVLTNLATVVSTYTSALAADAGSSLVGTAVVAGESSMSFKIRFTAVTGTPTYVVYAI